MAVRQFSIERSIGDSWIKVKENLKFWIPLGVIVFVVESLPRITGTSSSNSALLSFAAALFYWLLRTLVEMGIIKISLKTVDNKKAEYGDLLSESALLWKFIIGSILYTLIVLSGPIVFLLFGHLIPALSIPISLISIVLTILGVIWAIKYSYFSFLIIDQNLDPVEAIKKSGQITEGQKWHLFLLGLSLLGINILGVLCLLVGLFITIPVTILAWAASYRQLSLKVFPDRPHHQV